MNDSANNIERGARSRIMASGHAAVIAELTESVIGVLKATCTLVNLPAQDDERRVFEALAATASPL
jgi:hypothetical protein